MLLNNTFEGYTPSGTTITTGGTGSGTPFDGTAASGLIPAASDSAHAAHGSLSASIATSTTAGNCDLSWNAAGALSYSGSTLWFRQCLYFTANPAANVRVMAMNPAAGTCASFYITTTGKYRVLNSAGSQLLITTASVPLNSWFRVEGFVTFSATVGQVEVKLFSGADDAGAAETQTSGATAATSTNATTVFWGITGTAIASAGPYWIDDVAVSDGGYIGPVSTSASPSADLAAGTGVPGGPVPGVALNMTIQGV